MNIPNILSCNSICGITITIIFFWASSAVATPSIDQVSVASNTITLSGSGFGTKTTARPLVFDNFEAGANGQNIVGRSPTMTTLNSGSWQWGGVAIGGSAYPTYTTSNQRAGSTMAALADMDGAQYNKSLSISTQQSEYFASWYMYYDHYAGSISRNTKPYVMYGNSVENPIAYSGWGDLTDPSLRTGIIDNTWHDPNTDYGSPTTNSMFGKWYKFELYLKQSSPGVADGSYKLWITEPGQSTYLSLNRDPVQTRSSSSYWRQFTFLGAYCDSSPSDRRYRIYADDFYFDNTRARVELGNAPTYATTTIREIQPTNSWSTTSISATVNQGTLPNGTVYVYVIDPEGSVNSSGYSITLGSNENRPNVPSGLRIMN